MNTLIIYASMTGTTEQMALFIADELKRAGEEVVVKEAFEAYAEELMGYERILIGSYTWGNGELSDEILGFYDELANIDLKGKAAAAFGSGDSSYDYFARAVDILEGTLRNQGCEIITKGLKVDSYLESEKDIETKCLSFVKKCYQQ